MLPDPGHSSSPTQLQVSNLVVDEKLESLAHREYVQKESPLESPSVLTGAERLPDCRSDAAQPRDRAALEELTRFLFDRNEIPLIVLSPDGSRVLDANRAAVELLRYQAGNLVGSGGVPFLNDRRLSVDTLPAGRPSVQEMAVCTGEGGTMDVEMTIECLGAPGSAPIVLTLRDLNARKSLQQHLQQLEKMTVMGRMASGIAHEIRNPLAAVMLNLQLLDMAAGEQPRARQTIAAALEGVGRIEQVVKSTLHLARPAQPLAGREPLLRLIDGAVEHLRIPLSQREIRVVREDRGECPDVNGDPKQLQQVLLNLLQNAADVTPAGAAITVRTGCADGPDGRRAVVEITDEGPGIAPEVLRHLFEPFRTTKTNGTGLGLNISQQIMARHGGTITVAATGPQGTTFRLEFPLHPSTSGDLHVQG